MRPYYAEGPYRAEIVEQGLSKSSNGNPQVLFKVRIIESIDVNPLTYEQHERTIYWTLTEKTVDFVVDKLAILGFQGQSFRQLDPSAANHQSFVGQEIEVYCKHETYNGKDREKWDLSFQSASEPLDESEARKLDALFGRKLKDKCGSSAPAQREEKARETVPAMQTDDVPADANDDIPF